MSFVSVVHFDCNCDERKQFAHDTQYLALYSNTLAVIQMDFFANAGNFFKFQIGYKRASICDFCNIFFELMCEFMRKIELQETNFKKPRYSQLTVDIHLPTLLKRDPHSLDQLFCDNKTLNLPRFRFFLLFFGR